MELSKYESRGRTAWRVLSPWLPHWRTLVRVGLECYKLATAILSAYGATYLLHQVGIIDVGGGAAAAYWILGLMIASLALWFVVPAPRPPTRDKAARLGFHGIRRRKAAAPKDTR